MRNRKLLALITCLCVVLGLIMALSLSGCSSTSTTAATTANSVQPQSQQQSVVEFKLAHEHPLTSDLMQSVVIPWTQDVEKATNGRVKITIYPGESLGAADTYLDGVKSGMFDIAWSSVDYYPGRFDLSQILYYPTGIKTSGTSSYVYWDMYNAFPEIQKEYAGVKVLSVEGSCNYDMFISKKYGKDVTTLAGFQGMLSKAGGGILNDMVSALGAQPMTVHAPQQYEALQKGTVDAAYFPISDAPGFNLQDVVRSITIVDGPPCFFMDIMNPASYAKMTPGDQKIFDSLTGSSLMQRYAKYDYTYEQKAIDFFQKNGVQIIHLSAQDYANVQSAMAAKTPAYLDKVNAEGLPATAVYNKAKELAAKWEASQWWTSIQ